MFSNLQSSLREHYCPVIFSLLHRLLKKYIYIKRIEREREKEGRRRWGDSNNIYFTAKAWMEGRGSSLSVWSVKLPYSKGSVSSWNLSLLIIPSWSSLSLSLSPSLSIYIYVCICVCWSDCNCFKDRLLNRHSCLNLYPCVIKVQSINQSLTRPFTLYQVWRHHWSSFPLVSLNTKHAKKS